MPCRSFRCRRSQSCCGPSGRGPVSAPGYEPGGSARWRCARRLFRLQPRSAARPRRRSLARARPAPRGRPRRPATVARAQHQHEVVGGDDRVARGGVDAPCARTVDGRDRIVTQRREGPGSIQVAARPTSGSALFWAYDLSARWPRACSSQPRSAQTAPGLRPNRHVAADGRRWPRSCARRPVCGGPFQMGSQMGRVPSPTATMMKMGRRSAGRRGLAACTESAFVVLGRQPQFDAGHDERWARPSQAIAGFVPPAGHGCSPSWSTRTPTMRPVHGAEQQSGAGCEARRRRACRLLDQFPRRRRRMWPDQTSSAIPERRGRLPDHERLHAVHPDAPRGWNKPTGDRAQHPLPQAHLERRVNSGRHQGLAAEARSKERSRSSKVTAAPARASSGAVAAPLRDHGLVAGRSCRGSSSAWTASVEILARLPGTPARRPRVCASSRVAGESSARS